MYMFKKGILSQMYYIAQINLKQKQAEWEQIYDMVTKKEKIKQKMIMWYYCIIKCKCHQWLVNIMYNYIPSGTIHHPDY